MYFKDTFLKYLEVNIRVGVLASIREERLTLAVPCAPWGCEELAWRSQLRCHQNF